MSGSIVDGLSVLLICLLLQTNEPIINLRAYGEASINDNFIRGDTTDDNKAEVSHTFSSYMYTCMSVSLKIDTHCPF